jgi:hypothetical protein
MQLPAQHVDRARGCPPIAAIALDEKAHNRGSGELTMRWEYLRVEVAGQMVQHIGLASSHEQIDDFLGRAGEDGWELIATGPVAKAVGSVSAHYSIFFRRPKA